MAPNPKRTTIGAVSARPDGATQNALINKINFRMKSLNENKEICDKYGIYINMCAYIYVCISDGMK